MKNGSDQPANGASLGVTLLFAVLFILCVSWPQLADPFVRHDDFPALLGDHADYFAKTLTEGRWLNYWWTLRPILWPHQVNFVLYLIGWAVFAGAFAAHALPGARPVWPILLAALVVLTPQAFNIAQWFNTLIPGVWLLALYALLCHAVSDRAATRWMLVFVPLTFSAYTTYPFLILATCLLGTEATPRAYLRKLVTFAVALALAFLVAYALNWMAHGTFGIEVGDWREPNPADSLGEAMSNLTRLGPFVFLLLKSYGLGYASVGFVIYSIAALAFYLLFRHDRRATRDAVTPIALGLGLLILNLALSGVGFPVRATIFVWVCAAFAMVRAAMYLAETQPGQIAGPVILLAVTLFLSVQVMRNHQFFTPWQATTRALARQVPADVERLYIYGERWSLAGAGAAAIQSNAGLRERLRYLTGTPAIVCFETPEACAGLSPPFELRAKVTEPLFARDGDTLFLRLPQLEIAP